MKGEYVKDGKDNHSNMFAKLHQTQKFQHHLPPPQQLPTLHHHSFQVANPGECQTSEEVDSDSSPTGPSPTPIKRDLPTQTVHLAAASAAAPSYGNDGATIEVAPRPRGRPPGSKNKPKPPVIITRDAEPSMSPYVLELPGGIDIVESVTSFCRKRNMGLCILNGTGTVSNVTLRQPSTTPGASVTFHGRFDILSLSATVIQSNAHTLSSVGLNNGVANGFTISLTGPQGQVVGGEVVGSLFSAGTVYLIAASFNNPSFHRLPLEDERTSGSAGGGNEGRHLSSPAVSDGGDSGRSPPAVTAAAAVDSCGMSLYSCHLPSDVIWSPDARQPLQHPPPY